MKKSLIIEKKQDKIIPLQLLYIVDYINENIDKNIKIAELSSMTSWGKTHFSRVFKLYYNTTVYQYILEKKIELAKEKIALSDKDISTICKTCGFDSYSNFFHAFKKFTLMTPQSYRFYYRLNIPAIKERQYQIA